MSNDIDIQQALAAIKASFIDELPEKIQKIESLVMSVDKEDNLNELYRQVHSLKGSGGTLDISIITQVCHNFESFLTTQSSKIDDSQFADHALEYIDLLKECHQGLIHNLEHHHEIESKLLKLNKALDNNKLKVLASGLTGFELAILEQLFPKQLAITKKVTGLSALSTLTMEHFNVFITAMETADLNGAAVIAAIKHNQSQNKDITCILLTSSTAAKHDSVIDHVVQRDTSIDQNLEQIIKPLLSGR